VNQPTKDSPQKLKVALVTTSCSPETITDLTEYVEGRTDVERWYGLDTDSSLGFIGIAAGATPISVMVCDPVWEHAAENKRNSNLAREVDELVIFGEGGPGLYGGLITLCKLWGKKVTLNPHKNGGIKWPSESSSSSEPSSAPSPPESAQ
jgi:hypothetical protein